jgi:23S rRNA (cytidine1920-2'-O)/16S rRNA (cytidine1409-2'-O)-methyltransferase
MFDVSRLSPRSYFSIGSSGLCIEMFDIDDTRLWRFEQINASPPLDFSVSCGYPIIVRKKRLDVLLVERGLVESREQGRRLIMAGEVLVDGQVMDKPGMQVSGGADIRLRTKLPYVSRGGLKLETALDSFAVPVAGVVAADVGASTGGFTDCLLQRGARKVYAIDVGYGQLAWRLRQDPRVVVMERVNVRYLESLPEPIDLATVDVSFISLELVLPNVISWLKPAGDIIALIKPQFEAGRAEVGKGGVVKDSEVHRVVLGKILGWALDHGLAVRGLMASPLKGPAGNVEFLAHLTKGRGEKGIEIEEAIAECLGEIAKKLDGD